MRGTHILPLTGIRFFAAAWVVFCHFGALFISLLPILKPLQMAFSLGYLAVPLFFLLSGFILSHNYFASYSINQHHRFVFLRFARLWPVHFATFVLMLIYAGANNYSPGRCAEELLMIRSWFWSDLGLNYPAWSISAEWFAYIFLFPVAFIALRGVRSAMLLLGAVALLLAGASFVPGQAILGRGGEIVFLFLAGSALYQLRTVTTNVRSEWVQNAGLLLVISFIVLGGAMPRITIFTGFAALVFGLSYQRGRLARLLSTRYAVLGGAASYSLYMTHAVVGKAYGLFTGNMAPQSLVVRLMLLALLVTGLCGAAMASYRYIEEPASKALRRLASKSRESSPNLSGTAQISA